MSLFDEKHKIDLTQYKRIAPPHNPPPDTPHEIRIALFGPIRNYVSFAMKLLESHSEPVILKAATPALNKAVTVAEILKRRVAPLHQCTEIQTITRMENYEPIHPSPDQPLQDQIVEIPRLVSSLVIRLFRTPTPELLSHPGYQPPLTPSELQNVSAVESGLMGADAGLMPPISPVMDHLPMPLPLVPPVVPLPPTAPAPLPAPLPALRWPKAPPYPFGGPRFAPVGKPAGPTGRGHAWPSRDQEAPLQPEQPPVLDEPSALLPTPPSGPPAPVVTRDSPEKKRARTGSPLDAILEAPESTEKPSAHPLSSQAIEALIRSEPILSANELGQVARPRRGSIAGRGRRPSRVAQRRASQPTLALHGPGTSWHSPRHSPRSPLSSSPPTTSPKTPPSASPKAHETPEDLTPRKTRGARRGSIVAEHVHISTAPAFAHFGTSPTIS